MQPEYYWIYENKVIFKSYFNNKLNNYLNIISKYNELIFSNYDNYNITIKTNNKYYVEYIKNYKPSKFDQQVIIPENITHLTFGWNFNKQVIIPENVTHLTFDYWFNQQVIIPQNVTHLTFGFHFNQQVIIPQNVTHLTFGEKFNQQVIIPHNVTHLTFGGLFNKQVIIPHNVTHLTFGFHFNQQVIIPQNVTYLTFGFHFNQQVNLPNIKYIKLGCNNIDIIENLPNSVEEIEFDYSFRLELLNLPNSIKKISFFNSIYDKELNCLPEFIEYLELCRYYNKKIKKFPLNLKTIKCNKNYKYIDDFKDKYNIITY